MALLQVCFGGRIAEEMFCDDISSGAQSDIQMASKLVRKMITQWGMSEKLGPISFGEREEQIFLGREIQQHQDYSEETAQAIDGEVKVIIDECYDRATEILEKHMDILHSVAQALLERETLDREEIELLLKAEELPPIRKRRPAETVKEEKPVETPEEQPRTEFPKQPYPRPDTT